MKSLRTRLLVLLVAATSGLWVVGAWWIYVEARTVGQRLSDESLRETGGLLLQLAQHEITEHGMSLGVLLLRNETLPGDYEFRYQIWTDDLRSAYRTASSPDLPFMSLTADGFGWANVDGQRWRAFATWNKDRSLQIQIAQSVGYRQRLASSIFRRTSATLALLLPLAVAMIWWILAHSFRPLVASAESVAARSASDLQSIDETHAPTEVRPLLAALNRLLERIREALQLERRFTADAAHELRTPLAAIKANAQIIRGARTPQELTEAADDLLISVDRSSRMIDQLLALARADSMAGSSGEFDTVDLGQLIAAQCAEQHQFAFARGIRLVTEPGTCTVNGRRDLLGILLRNLIDNAIRYCPTGSTITVACREIAGMVELSVTDDGPGIPAAERSQVFERFYRRPGQSESGSGLGLSIVRRIAELHQATVLASDGRDGRGTAITVKFGGIRT